MENIEAAMKRIPPHSTEAEQAYRAEPVWYE